MAKIPKPRDYNRIKDELMSWIFHFLFNVYRAIGVYIGLFGLLFLLQSRLGVNIHIQHHLRDTAIIMGVLFAILYGFVIYLRITRYREIPQGWTREQFLEKVRLDSKSIAIPDRFSRIYWLGFVALCAVIEGVWLVPSGNYFAVFPLFMFALFFWICAVVVKQRVSMSPSERAKTLNAEKLWLDKMRARQRSVMKRGWNVIILSSGIVVVGLEVLGAAGVDITVITILFFVGVVVARKIERHLKLSRMSVNERLREEYGYKGEKMDWKITFGRSKGWSWKGGRLPPVRDYRNREQEAKYEEERKRREGEDRAGGYDLY